MSAKAQSNNLSPPEAAQEPEAASPRVPAFPFRLRPENSPRVFWFLLVLLGIPRLVMLSDVFSPITYGPVDMSLYVSRAYCLPMNQGFGPYDSYLLTKHPGISLWMCSVRLLGLPFLLSVNLAYIITGIYFVEAGRRCRINSLVLLSAYVLYLANPVSYGRPFCWSSRDGLYPALFVLLLGSMISVLTALRARRVRAAHLSVLCFAACCLLLPREKGVLICFLLAVFGALAYLSTGRLFSGPFVPGKVVVMAVVFSPFLAAFCANTVVSLFIKAHYGTTLINDFGSGEFPRFIAALRSVKSDARTRYVSIPQETLQKVRVSVPPLAPLIDRLPPPPDTKSEYYPRFKVEGEWTNSHFFFWIKEAAHRAGLTPTLPAAQKFFRDARLEIEAARQQKRLQCESNGSGLIPPLRRQWIPDLLSEVTRSAEMTVDPHSLVTPHGNRDDILRLNAARGVVNAPPGLPAWVAIRLGRWHQDVTPAPFDSLMQWRSSPAPPLPGRWNENLELHASLAYWIQNPEVA